MELDPKKITEDLTAEQRLKVRDYQKLYMRLKVLKSQMADIQDETHDLIETLDKMRNKDKNKEEDNG
jgi:septation ring formation regulator EzrA